jgi:large subunit ribosomal protein L22
MAETKKKATAEVKEEAKATKKPAAKKAPAKKAAAPKKEAAPEAAPKAEEKKPAKKAEVKAEPVKAKVTEAHAVARDVRVTPRKVRLVMDLVRGKNVNEALELLFHVNKAASDPVAKLIKSAAANATNNFGMAGDKLYVAEIQASDGVRMKRFEPRGKGASSPIIKRTSFMRVTVKER